GPGRCRHRGVLARPGSHAVVHLHRRSPGSGPTDGRRGPRTGTGTDTGADTGGRAVTDAGGGVDRNPGSPRGTDPEPDRAPGEVGRTDRALVGEGPSAPPGRTASRQRTQKGQGPQDTGREPPSRVRR